MFKGQSYSGPSFYDFIRADHPDLLPDFGKFDWGAVQIPHGTTVLALVYDEGALIAGDRLATEGYQVATRDIEKVYTVDDHCVVAIAGAAGPAIETVRVFQTELEHYQKLEGQVLSFEGKANRLSFLIRQNLPAAMQGLVVMPLFAGYDLAEDRGRIYKFDITGGRYEESEFDATGSGGLYARESLKHSWSADMDRDLGVRAAVAALTAAADEDRATGGVDLERGIYPVIKVCTSDGHRDASEEEIASCYRSILEARTAGGNL